MELGARRTRRAVGRTGRTWRLWRTALATTSLGGLLIAAVGTSRADAGTNATWFTQPYFWTTSDGTVLHATRAPPVLHWRRRSASELASTTQ